MADAPSARTAPVDPGEALARLADERVDHRFKGLPPDADGLTVAELAAQRRNLFTDGFTTPVLTLSAERLEHNLALMEAYAERHGLAFAPHGKTSMAPQLFQRQLDRGAWGITLAVPHQVPPRNSQTIVMIAMNQTTSVSSRCQVQARRRATTSSSRSRRSSVPKRLGHGMNFFSTRSSIPRKPMTIRNE